jgi:tRNA-Thr(GGU) m(6)t(6)A37 methyltransferase TsaA
MADETELFEMQPIGVVHSEVVDRRMIPPNGVPAVVEVFEEFEDGLLLVEENSHLWLLAWLRGTEREQLQIVRPDYAPQRRRRGVFGLRSTTRPNPFGLTAARLLRVDGRMLHLGRVDLIDGTTILDIKRYTPSLDSIFGARSSRDRYESVAVVAALAELESAAEFFHGDLTPEVVAGARLVQHVCQLWQVRPKDDQLGITFADAAECGAIADALQGCTAASFGNRRLRVSSGHTFELTYNGQALRATPRDLSGLALDELRVLPIERLFELKLSSMSP